MNQAEVGIFFVVKGPFFIDEGPPEQWEVGGVATKFSNHFDYGLAYPKRRLNNYSKTTLTTTLPEDDFFYYNKTYHF